MRSLTLLALLIASNFAIPFGYPKNALSRRASTNGNRFARARSSIARSNSANETGESGHKNLAPPGSHRAKSDVIKDVVKFFNSRNIDNVVITENSVLVGLLIKDGIISQEDLALLGDYNLLNELFIRYGSLKKFTDKEFSGDLDDKYEESKELGGSSDKENEKPKELDEGSGKEHDKPKELGGSTGEEKNKPKEIDGSSDKENEKPKELEEGSGKEHDKSKELGGSTGKEQDKPEEPEGFDHENIEPHSDHRIKGDVIEDVVEFFYNKEIDNISISDNNLLIGMLINDGVISQEDLALLGDYNLLYELFIRYGSLNEFIGKEFGGGHNIDDDKPTEDHTEENVLEVDNWKGWGQDDD